MIRVLIDATGITRKKAGVGVYGKNLIEQLLALQQVELFLVVQDDDPDLNYTNVPHLHLLRVPSKLMRKVPLRLLFEQTILPLLLLRYRIDVVHSLHFLFPLFRFGARSVVTVHDMTWFSMPEMHSDIFKLRYFQFFIKASRTRCDALIFVSRSAQNDFVARFGQPTGLSRVVYHGKSTEFSADRDPDAIAAVRQTYSLPSRYILYVGTIEPRKNLDRLLHAFAMVAPAHPELSLVIAGKMGWKQDHLFQLVESLHLNGRVHFPGFVAEADKSLLIAGSEIFAYVSLYEGFGLPVLEAMASGVPTITSDASSLPEVAGDAALLIDPMSIPSITEAIESLLSDAGLRNKLRHAGPVQAAKFSWEIAATETMAIYQALGKGKG